MLTQLFAITLFMQALDPWTTPILPCSRVVTSYDQMHHRFIIEATTPIKTLKVTKSSGATFQSIEGNKAVVTMKITDERNFFIDIELVDECDTWHPGMKTL